MNNLTNNDLELITQLLDGELSSEQAAEVTKMIESSPEMQAEMDRLTEISDAIRKDDEQFIHTKKAKDNVFLALGIPLAVSAPSLTNLTSEIANLVSLAAAVSASVLTFSMFYSLNDVDNSNLANDSKIPIVSSIEKAQNNNIIVEDEPRTIEIEDNLANGNVEDSNSNIVANRNSNNDFKVNNSNSSSSIIVNDAIGNKSDVPISSERNSFEVQPNREFVQAWNANIITSRKSGIQTNNNIFLDGVTIETSGLTYTRDYLTVIRTKATTSNLNSGQFDVSFLTNYFAKDLRGIISAGMSWYDQNAAINLKTSVFIGGGIEYTPTFTNLFANKYYDTFINGQLLLGSNPSYKLETGISTYLGGITKFPIVVGYSRNYIRDYPFINQELNEGLFIGTEISF